MPSKLPFDSWFWFLQLVRLSLEGKASLRKARGSNLQRKSGTLAPSAMANPIYHLRKGKGALSYFLERNRRKYIPFYLQLVLPSGTQANKNCISSQQSLIQTHINTYIHTYINRHQVNNRVHIPKPSLHSLGHVVFLVSISTSHFLESVTDI